MYGLLVIDLIILLWLRAMIHSQQSGLKLTNQSVLFQIMAVELCLNLFYDIDCR